MKGFYNSEKQFSQERLTVELSNERKEELNPRKKKINEKIQLIKQSFNKVKAMPKDDIKDNHAGPAINIPKL